MYTTTIPCVLTLPTAEASVLLKEVQEAEKDLGVQHNRLNQELERRSQLITVLTEYIEEQEKLMNTATDRLQVRVCVCTLCSLCLAVQQTVTTHFSLTSQMAGVHSKC